MRAHPYKRLQRQCSESRPKRSRPETEPRSGGVSLLATRVATLGRDLRSTRAASADQIFHSTRPSLMAITSNQLRNGDVVDIHPNGPVNYAIEIYHLNGAGPNTTHEIFFRLSGALFSTPVCGVTSVPFGPVSSVMTNARGDAHNQLKIPPSFVTGLGLHGQTPEISWVFEKYGIPAYQTACIPVALD